MQRARIGCRSRVSHAARGSLSICAKLGQDAQVLLGRLFRHQQQEHQD